MRIPSRQNTRGCTADDVDPSEMSDAVRGARSRRRTFSLFATTGSAGFAGATTAGDTSRVFVSGSTELSGVLPENCCQSSVQTRGQRWKINARHHPSYERGAVGKATLRATSRVKQEASSAQTPGQTLDTYPKGFLSRRE